MEKVNTIDPKIIVRGSVDKPYYSIEYYDTADNQWHIGYGSYELKNVIEWLKTDFDVIETDVEPVRHGKWRKLPHGRYNCSNCHCIVNHEEQYCEFCGALMDGDTK